jgi:hypothetical protein
VEVAKKKGEEPEVVAYVQGPELPLSVKGSYVAFRGSPDKVGRDVLFVVDSYGITSQNAPKQ